jgi:hypothetical protein
MISQDSPLPSILAPLRDYDYYNRRHTGLGYLFMITRDPMNPYRSPNFGFGFCTNKHSQEIHPHDLAQLKSIKYALTSMNSLQELKVLTLQRLGLACLMGVLLCRFKSDPIAKWSIYSLGAIASLPATAIVVGASLAVRGVLQLLSSDFHTFAVGVGCVQRIVQKRLALEC